jgi:hypothetical protein
MRTFIITSIAAPNAVMRDIAAGAREGNDRFIVIGDTKSPIEFELDSCEFISVAQQKSMGSRFAEACPYRHYARKNIGYLSAIQAGAAQIIETDDDNFPEKSFFAERSVDIDAPVAVQSGWLNVYRYFQESGGPIWPRGLPLDSIHAPAPSFPSLKSSRVHCPIQQGLADGNPDVDAIYRLTGTLPFDFLRDRRVALAPGVWCPFNSQNTTWWPEAYALTYLPAHCSFRVTDIWRSFVAQRIAHANGWHILFDAPTVRQERNEHSLMKDFEDEIPGYLNNDRIRILLEDLPIDAGVDKIAANLRKCYAALVHAELVGKAELDLLPLFLEEGCFA